MSNDDCLMRYTRVVSKQLSTAAPYFFLFWDKRQPAEVANKHPIIPNKILNKLPNNPVALSTNTK